MNREGFKMHSYIKNVNHPRTATRGGEREGFTPFSDFKLGKN